MSGSSVPNDSSATNNESEYSHTEGEATVLLPSISYLKLVNAFIKVNYKHMETPKNSLKVIYFHLDGIQVE